MRGGCPNFLIIFCVTQRRLLQVHEQIHATARGAQRVALLVFEQTQTQTRLSSSELSRAEASEACGIFSCCFVSTVSSVSLAR